MKRIFILVIALTLLTSTLSINASQGSSASRQGTRAQSGNLVTTQQQQQQQQQNQTRPLQLTPEEQQAKFDDFFTELEQRHDARFDEFSLRWTENQAKRDSANAAFIELVTQYAPDMVTSFETAFDDHDAVHIALFEKRTSIYTEVAAQTSAELLLLKEEIDAKLASQEITVKEARAMIKAYLTERKTEVKASTEAFKAAIAVEKAAQEVRVQEVKTIHVALKAAIEVNDVATIEASIDSLYTYLLAHIAFDNFKLATLNELF